MSKQNKFCSNSVDQIFQESKPNASIKSISAHVEKQNQSRYNYFKNTECQKIYQYNYYNNTQQKQNNNCNQPGQFYKSQEKKDENQYIYQNQKPELQIGMNKELELRKFKDLCKLQDMITIDLGNQNYDHLLLYNHTLFYYKSNSLQYDVQLVESSKSFFVSGKLYYVQFDRNKNPQFLIQEGLFQLFLKEKKFNLNGQGIEYFGKSNDQKYRGEFVNGKYKEIQQNETNQIRSQSVPIRKILIYDFDTGSLLNKDLNNKHKVQEQKSVGIWCKYNQQISIQDIKLLKQKGRLTSSIIDSYVNHLNLLSEEEYFNKDRDQSKTKSKILFLPTSLTTNFGENYTFESANRLFRMELLQFQEMNYQIKKIYQQIGFPINKQNYHWYFVLFDFTSHKCLVFDSLKNPKSSVNLNEKLLQTLSYILQIQLKQIELSEYSGQQEDGYSCGYHICQFMKYCQEIQFGVKKKYNYKQDEIAEILSQVIRNNSENIPINKN